MYKIVFSFLGFVPLLLPLFVSAQATTPASGEQQYAAFSTKALLLRNGDLSVNEQFVFDFGVSAKKGIIRTIPLVVTEHGRHFSIDSVSVTDKMAAPYIFDLRSGGNTASLKIGDPKKILTGTHFYDIKYTLRNVAGETDLIWTLFSPVKEVVSKFQSDLYFPIPVPEATATATCSFQPVGGECNAVPLTKSGLTAGYRITTETLKGQSITLSVSYPKNLITPMVNSNGSSSIHKNIFILIIGIIFSIFTFLVIMKRHRIRSYIQLKLSHNHSKENFSYLVRAMAFRDKIEREDILATIADLVEREYLLVEAMPNNDYHVLRSSADLPMGAEGYFCSLFTSTPISLKDWFVNEYPKHQSEIELRAAEELKGISLRGVDEHIPTLKNFELP